MLRTNKLIPIATYLVLLTFSTQCFGVMINTDTLAAGKRSQSEYFNTNLDSRLTVKVQIVGGVGSPGVYHLPDNSTLLEALSLAGGATNNADLSKVYVRRMVGNETKSFQYDLPSLMKDTSKPLPTISNRDTILIEPQSTQASTTLAMVATIMGIISSGLLAYVTINNITKNK